MKIEDILESTSSKMITIITPNKIEKKLLIDRFRFRNAIFFKNNVIKYKDVIINVITVDEVKSQWETIVDSFFLIEFPEAIPDSLFFNLHLKNKDFAIFNEII